MQTSHLYTPESQPLDRSPSLSSNSSGTGSAVSTTSSIPTPALPSSSSFPSSTYPHSKDDHVAVAQLGELSLNGEGSPSYRTAVPRANGVGAGERKSPSPWSAGHRTGAGSKSFDSARAKFGEVGRSPSLRNGVLSPASREKEEGQTQPQAQRWRTTSTSSSTRTQLGALDTSASPTPSSYANSPSTYSPSSSSTYRPLPTVPSSPTRRPGSPFSSTYSPSNSRPSSPTKLSSNVPFPTTTNGGPASPSQPFSNGNSSPSARALSSSIFSTRDHSPALASPDGTPGLGRMGSMRRFDSVGSATGRGGMGHRRAMTLPQNLLDERGLPAPPAAGGAGGVGVSENEVVGLPGRARLSRPAEAPSSFAPSAVFSSSHGLSTLSSSPHLSSTSSPALPSGSLLPSLTVKAIDRQRHNLVAYEYLCHCRETQEWLDGCVGVKVRGSELWIGAEGQEGEGGKGMKEWEQGLRNGYALAHLARALGSPACGGPIYNDPVRHFRHTANINIFFTFLEEVQLPVIFHFETVDLYEGKNLPKVIYCLHALSHLLFRRGMAERMGDLVGLVDFSDAEVQATEKGLDGVRMPNFKGIGKALDRQTESEEDRRARELRAAEEAEARRLAEEARIEEERRMEEEKLAEERRVEQAKRAEERRREQERREQMEREAREEAERRLEEERLAKEERRAAEQRRREEEERARIEAEEQARRQHEADVRAAIPTFVRFQAHARSELARRQLDHRMALLAQHQPSIMGFQAHCRTYLALQRQSITFDHLHSTSPAITAFQAHARGALARRRVLSGIHTMRLVEDTVVGIQAAVRAKLARDDFAARRRNLRQASVVRSVGGFQSAARAALVKRQVSTQRQALGFVQPNVVGIQAQTRGHLGRGRFLAWMDHIYRHEDHIVQLQSLLRGLLARRRHDALRSALHHNRSRFVGLQAIVRSRRQGDQYRQLRMGTNVPASTIKNFVHLLDDSEFDYRGEVLVEQMRKQLVGMIRETQGMEDDVKDLDTKIALLVKNKITHEVARAQRSGGTGGLASHRRDHLLAADKDPFASDVLDRQTARKHELYQQLFWHLQSNPEYFAKLLANPGGKDRGDKAQKALEAVTFIVFGFAQAQREEYLLLKLFQRSIQEDLHFVPDISSFVRGSFAFIRLFQQYGRGVNQRKSLQIMLATSVKHIMATHVKKLSTDPVAIYHAMRAEEETRTGVPSQKPASDVDWRFAIGDQATNVAFIQHLKSLRASTEVLLKSIFASTGSLPFGIRFVMREVFRSLRHKFPQQPEEQLLRVTGHLLYYRFIQPAIVAPETFSILESVVPDIQRHNLAECAKMINQIAAGRAFGEDQFWLHPLNNFVEVKAKEFSQWIRAVIHVPDAEAYFRADEWLDAKASRQPIIYISPNNIYALHSSVLESIDAVAPKQDDPLRVILGELGCAPLPASGELGRARADEIPLTLIARLTTRDDPQAGDKALFQQAKRRIVAVLKVHHGADLVAVFAQPVTPQDEEAWYRIVQEEIVEEQRQARAARRPVIAPTDDLRRLSFQELKIAAVQDVMALRAKGVVSGNDKFQALLDSIASDIRLKHHRRVQRQSEIATMEGTLASLRSKKTYLNDQIRSYHEYIDQSMASIQKKSKKRLVLPWSLQASHQRKLEKEGKRYAFGSYKYTAQDLYDRGVLLSIDQFSPKQFDKVTLTISSDEIGVFEVSAAYMGVKVETVELKLDELLEAQFAAKQTLPIGGVAKVNLNLLVHLINKKFYA